jgi:CRISPR/Cas system Type II protein with McrA/HNH and RuvC-like nuclease domain
VNVVSGASAQGWIDCGVRVFPEGVDAFDTAKEQSGNAQRRMKRMMRRQIRRRARRRH